MTASELLIEIGVDVSTKGGRMLVYCVEQVAKRPELADSIVKLLYPMAADHFGVSENSVERNMRTATRRMERSPSWAERLHNFEASHKCVGLFSADDTQTLKRFIVRLSYILNEEATKS